ncbi:MAG: ABC transporter permease [Armatimonadota bacterium]|nr:ABC transporter permease [Armatimonadota bacterium]MDR7450581.1 ABC transporter permease [Armatimonadota bacterium]MDR7466286.1 ABC transporter permease [Armatimonadota bacterium]MDR7493007.1 ABC transporter permease [Armatimonadota bacterium]MDR7498236.1 ABC transporter permease [Armatimonadota bacterium]
MRVGPVVVERRDAPSWSWTLAISALAVGMALTLAGAIFWSYGVPPLRAYGVIVRGTLFNARAAPEIVRNAIPLLLAGVGLVLAFRALFWNIGAEGQILLGATAATWVALFSPVPDAWKLPAMFAAGFVGGALWGLIPALLKLRFAVNEVISTLMMNYIALYLVSWLVHGPWKGPEMRGFAFTNAFPAAARIPTIADTRVHWPTLMLGLLLAAAVAYLLARTRAGFEIRMQGENPEAARYAGVDPLRTTMLVMVIAGGAAGLAGVGEVGGIHHRLLDPTQISLGFGYAAIIVAWLARGSPLAAIGTAAFLGLIFASGDVMRVALQMPARVTDVFNGLILFCLIGSERALSWRLRWAPGGARQPAAAPPETVASEAPGSDR